MGTLEPNRAPPPDYYADNVRMLVATVLEQYVDLLTTAEVQFGESVLNLSNDAARLLARLVTRKYACVRIDSLHYREVIDLNGAIEELESRGFITINGVEEVEEALQLLTVADLRELCSNPGTQLRKAELIENLIKSCPTETALLERIARHAGWVRLEVHVQLSLYRRLFFGNSFQQLEEFVIHDLGLSRFESYRLDREHRLFANREELDRSCELDELAVFVDERGVDITVDEVEAILPRLESLEENRTFERRRSAILNALGRNLERASEFDLALKCYSLSLRHPARERTMRILFRQSQLEELEAVRELILQDALTLEEQAFAIHFKRPKQKQKELPIERSAMPSHPVDSIESYAVSELERTGMQAWHLENALPMGLFALAYWDWIYAPVRGAFVNPFQSMPRDMFWPEFFDVRRGICSDPLEELGSLKRKILSNAEEKTGITNFLIAWTVFTQTNLDMILNAISIERLRDLLCIVIEDLEQFRSGFPDLTVINESDELEFIEVKGPGDQIRPNQRIWIERLMTVGIPVKVWRFQ